MLNSDSRSRSAVGRIACEWGEARVRPPRRPPTMRIGPSAPLAADAAAFLAPRQLGLAQPLGIGRAALHLSAPRRRGPSRLAICDRSHLRTTDLFRWKRMRNDGRRKVGTRERRDPLAQLLAQMTGAHLHDRAFGQIAELKRAERHPDQPVHRKPKMAEHVLDLAVLALAHREDEPHIAALLTLELRLDRPVAHAVDGDALAQLVEAHLLHAAVRTHAVAA